MPMPDDRKGKKRGPKEDRLAIGGDWQQAMAAAMKKKRPPGGWPKATKGDGGDQAKK